MSTTGSSSELDAVEVETPRAAELPISMSPIQRKALTELCRLHERDFSLKRFTWRTLLLVLYIAFALGFCVLIQFMTAFAGPAYLIFGFVLGALLKELRISMLFRLIWAVYDAIIDWPRAFRLLKDDVKSRRGDTNPYAPNHEGLESAKPDLPSVFKKPGGWTAEP